MSKRLTCPSGHQWDADDVPFAPAPPVCPECGADAKDASAQTEAIVAEMPIGSWPHLGQLPSDDPGATITVDPNQTVRPDSLDFQITIDSLANLPQAVRQSVPGYDLLAELGRGGMGVVYKAQQIELRRIVALKMVLAGVHLSPRDLERFRSEASAIAGLQHVNIVQLYEFGEHDGRPYFSLEYVDGGSLAQRLKGEPLPAQQAAWLTEKLARALHFAHQRGIVHRDIKPANVLLTGEGEPKITDFGLAKQVHVPGTNTQTGTVMGTPSYMAPEQAMGKSRDVGPAADVYALGAILYEMLSGRPPFRSETPLDTMLQVASEEPVPLSRLQPRLPPDLQTICMKCLQKLPHKRYPSAHDLADDLRRYLQGEPIDARPIGKLERAYRWARRRPAAAALIALAVFTVLAGFAGVTWQWHQEAERRADIERAQRETAETLVKAENSLYCNRIALAEREWLAANMARARLLLRDCRTERRGWEWYYLHRLCHADFLTLRGHDNSIYSVAFSADGRHLVSGSVDQAVKTWDATTGKLLQTQQGPVSRDRAIRVVFGPDGRRILSAGSRPFVQTWEALTGKEVHNLHRPEGNAVAVAFSPDRQRLAWAGADGMIKVWTVGTERVQTLPGKVPGVTCLAFGVGGRHLAAGALDGQVRVWDTANLTLFKPIVAHQGAVHGIAFSPEGRRLASAGADTTVKVWEALSGKLLTTFRGHHQAVSCVAFAPSKGMIIASAGRDQVIKLWNAGTGEELYTLRGHTDRIRCLAFRRDGAILASAGDDRVVKVWDATTGQESRTAPATGASNCLAVHGQHLATADSRVQVWDPITLKPLPGVQGKADMVRGLAYHPDGHLLAMAGDGLKLRDAATGRVVLVLAPSSPVHFRSAAFSPDGKQLATGGDDGNVCLWDAATGARRLTLVGHREAVLGVAFSPDGRRLASAGGDHKVRLWDAGTGQELQTLHDHKGSVNCVAFDPLGRFLASGGDGPGDRDGEAAPYGEIIIWDAATGARKQVLWGHSGAVNSLAFTPDGERLASASDDQTIKLWELAFGQEVLTLRGHTGAVLGVAFSGDGNYLASIAADQTLRLWNATPMR